MQKGVHGRFLDQSTSVREAAVELVGRFILIRPELIPDYYQMLSDRILVRFTIQYSDMIAAYRINMVLKLCLQINLTHIVDPLL